MASSRALLRALVLALTVLTAVPQARGAGWAFAGASHEPPAPDHEQSVLFTARVELLNETEGGAGNGTTPGGNETGNETENGGGAGNWTGGNETNVTVLGVRLIIGPAGMEEVHNMTPVELDPDNRSAAYAIALGPFAPGQELPYRFEALLSNGSGIRSNLSWLRVQDIVEVKWHRSLQEALGLAEFLGRPLLVLVYDPFRGSRMGLEEALSDPRVLSLSARFVCVELSSADDPSLPSKYGIRNLPGVVFLNASTGAVVERVEGNLSGRELARAMESALGVHRAGEPGPDPYIVYRLSALALSLSLVAGLAALLALLRRRRIA